MLQFRVVVVQEIIKLPNVQLLLWEHVFIVLLLECISVNYVLKGNISHIVLNVVKLVMARTIALYIAPLSSCLILMCRIPVIWTRLLAFSVKKRGILLDVVLKNNVQIAKNMVINLKIVMYSPVLDLIDRRKCRNVMDVEKVDIRSVIVLNEDVKLVENQLIDDTNVVQGYSPPENLC